MPLPHPGPPVDGPSVLKRRHALVRCLLGCLLIPFLWSACAFEDHRHRHHLPNVTEYLDRLDRPERDRDQKPAEVVQALGLQAGMTVADLGAGSGYFTQRFAEAVLPDGKVYAIDIEEKALEHVRARLAGRDTGSVVEYIRADPQDPKLPRAAVDVLFVCNTYHHLEQRPQYFAQAASAIRPGGRLVIIDFHADERSGDLGFGKDHLIPQDRVEQELKQAGYTVLREHRFLPRQYFLEFEPPRARD